MAGLALKGGQYMCIHTSREAGANPPFEIGPAGEALSLMLGALDRLDSDATIPAIIGAQLQHAIDTLCSSYLIELPSELH